MGKSPNTHTLTDIPSIFGLQYCRPANIINDIDSESMLDYYLMPEK